VKFRGWLLVLLFLHVLLHPLVHASATITPATALPSISGSAQSGHGLATGDHCELCRVGHNLIGVPQLPQTDLLNPSWIHTTLQAVNYASLQASRSIPSRAPPSL
jgi:Protein of unknown function (DUF2946)